MMMIVHQVQMQIVIQTSLVLTFSYEREDLILCTHARINRYRNRSKLAGAEGGEPPSYTMILRHHDCETFELN